MSCRIWTSRRRTTWSSSARTRRRESRALAIVGWKSHAPVGRVLRRRRHVGTDQGRGTDPRGGDRRGLDVQQRDEGRRASPSARSRARAGPDHREQPAPRGQRRAGWRVVGDRAHGNRAGGRWVRPHAVGTGRLGLLGPVGARRAQLAVVARPLVAYLVHAHSMSTNTRLLDEDVRRFRQKHAARPRPHGTSNSTTGTGGSYVAEMHLRDGRRLRAAREYLRAVRQREPARMAARRGLPRGAGVGEPRDFGTVAVRRTDPAWVADVEAWLAPADRKHRLEERR